MVLPTPVTVNSALLAAFGSGYLISPGLVGRALVQSKALTKREKAMFRLLGDVALFGATAGMIAERTCSEQDMRTLNLAVGLVQLLLSSFGFASMCSALALARALFC